MKAVILAAGVASRLRPLTDNLPKCLLSVGKKNILAITLDHLILNQIDQIIIVTGFLEYKIRDYISLHYPTLEVEYILNEIYLSTNNIYSLWLTRQSVSGQDILLLDSDILFDKEIIGKLVKSGYENCLALKKHDVNEEEIKVKVDPMGRILQIGKEVNLLEAIGESIGIEKFSARFIERLMYELEKKITREKKVNLFYEAAFQNLINEGEEIYAVDVSDHFCMEIDVADDLELARQMVSQLSS